MDEYIRREDVIEWFMPYAHVGESIDADVVIFDIKGMKAADVAPVTRCKDCANSYEDAFGRVCAYGICVDCTVPDDFYCASSKPKEEDHADNHD